MKQTYNHAGVSIYHGDCRDLVLTEPADVMITDPPFSAHTHKNAKTNKGKGTARKVITFEHRTHEDLYQRLFSLLTMVTTWAIRSFDFLAAAALEAFSSNGWEFFLVGLWIMFR